LFGHTQKEIGVLFTAKSFLQYLHQNSKKSKSPEEWRGMKQYSKMKPSSVTEGQLKVGCAGAGWGCISTKICSRWLIPALRRALETLCTLLEVETAAWFMERTWKVYGAVKGPCIRQTRG